jgi:poly(hydroxyalkanoate) granule-associated protein
MVKKLHTSETADNSKATGEQLKSSVKDSAQQIWQAGLGAFAKAQAEGTRAFEALVKEGSLLQRKTQTAAEEKMSEATSKMSNMASDISSRASGHWDKLETIFEDRVAKALGKLGVPSAQDVNALKDRFHSLDKTVEKLSKKPASTATPAAKKTAGAGAKSAPGSATRSASKPKSTPKSAAKPAAKVAPKPLAKRTAPRKSA